MGKQIPPEDNPITNAIRRMFDNMAQPALPVKTTAPPAAPIHQHRYRIIQAQAGQRRPLEDNHTIVIYGCADPDCEWVEDQVIQGTWKLADLKAATTPENPGPTYAA